MHAKLLRMSRASEVSVQLRAALEKSRIDEKIAEAKFVKAGGDRVTFYRVLGGKAKTEPKAQTLRLIASSIFGLSKEQLFPESGALVQALPPALIVPADEDIKEPGYKLSVRAGVSEEIQREVEAFIRYANRRQNEMDQIEAAKKGRKKKGA